MKNRTCSIGILVILCLLPALVVTAQEHAATAHQRDELARLVGEQVVLGDLLSTDDFGEESDWPTGGTATQAFLIEDEQYLISVDGEGAASMTYPKTYQDVVVRVSADQRSDEEGNAFGLACRVNQQNTQGYIFTITNTGSYAILKNTPEGLESLGVGGESDDIETGTATNDLVIVCVGSYLAFYANGELLAEAEDENYQQGRVGFLASGVDADVAFDDLWIWEASSNPELTPTPTVITQEAELKVVGGDSKDAIAELEALGLIPSGSTFIFGEDYAFFRGIGVWFTPLASDTPRQNIVMGGELTFTTGDTDDQEFCALTARIVRSAGGDATSFINVGLLNDGYIALADSASPASQIVVETSSAPVDLSEPHDFLILLIDDKATVFVDGVRVIDEFTVHVGSGTYGISLLGAGSGVKCEGRNIWAYQVVSSTPGVCLVTANKAVNQRSGPGTDFDISGQLAAGQAASVAGQARDDDGQTWWQLGEDAWVRSDVVIAVGDCVNVPTVEP